MLSPHPFQRKSKVFMHSYNKTNHIGSKVEEKNLRGGLLFTDISKINITNDNEKALAPWKRKQVINKYQIVRNGSRNNSVIHTSEKSLNLDDNSDSMSLK